ncbi:lysine N(6)-hydroxylase/L-ornithine N(5)-oxygenase family protein [Vibrio sp. DNB22_10_4]
MKTVDFDLVGVGIGPFNLSIAALAAPKAELKSQFYERKPEFAWHPGLLLNHAKMQTSFLKDLVTAVDPTSPYTFMNYLVKNQKFYPFTARGDFMISRLEFSDYMAWTAKQLPNTQFATDISEVRFADDHFVITANGESVTSRHLVVGTGTQPVVPECVEGKLSEHCFHAHEMMVRKPDLTGKRIAIIGGGQTGADIFQHVFAGDFGKPRQLDWVSRRANLEGLDESCFSDQFFMPDYVNQFYHLDKERQAREVSRQKLTSDGITDDCLTSIYQSLYHDKYVLRNPKWWTVQPHQELVGLNLSGKQHQLRLRHGVTEHEKVLEADVVILCTGFKRVLAPCLLGMADKLQLDELSRPLLNSEYAALWKQPCDNKLFVVNSGTHNHGIIEPQLSLAAWRAAKILNHANGDELYHHGDSSNVMEWGLNSVQEDRAEVAEMDLSS